MRSKEYQKRILEKINSYERSHRNFIIGARISEIIGLFGLLSVIIGYVLYSDTSTGISLIPYRMSLMISFIGFIVGTVGVIIGLNLQNEADSIQSRINRIKRMIIH